MLTLRYAPPSPYARKVRIAADLLAIPLKLEPADTASPDDVLLGQNPLGKVPVLIDEAGERYYDSRVIVEYLDTLTPVGKLIPAQSRERAAVKCWEALGDGMLDAAILVRLEKTLRPAEQQSQIWMDRQMAKVHAGLKTMAADLGETPYCTGNQFTLADVAVGCTVGWLSFRFPEITWRDDYPNLARLFDKVSERASFKDTVPH